MSDTILKAGCVVLLLAVVFLSGVCWVNLRTIDGLTTRNEELIGALKAIDLKAKADEQFYKGNEREIKDKNTNTIASLNARYDRLLHARDNISTSETTGNPKDNDGTAAELQANINFERACALDANQVNMFQEWVRINKFPLAD
jgi:hypothetical protein